MSGHSRRVQRGPAVLAVLVVLSAVPAAANGQQGAPNQWMGAMVGAHVGIDYLFEGFVAGGRSVLLVDPWGRISLIPNAEIELRRGIRDWQANLDGAVMPVRGIYVGAGLAYRNTIFDEEIGRQTRRGHSVFVGYRDLPAPGRVSPQIELRWSFVGGIRPRTVTIGANFPVLLFR